MLCPFFEFLQDIRRELNRGIEFLTDLYLYECIGIVVDNMIGEETCICTYVFI